MFQILILLALSVVSVAQSTCGLAPSGSIRPSVASGYTWQVVATGLSSPRGLSFDGAGNLLVVEAGSGVVSSHVLSEDVNQCVSVQSSSNVTEAINLNHGIAVSPDSGTLYASNSSDVFAWSYNTSLRSVSNRRTLVSNMTGTDHSTRTLLLPKSAPGMLVVSFGSESNLDIQATSLASGSASVKAFNLSNMTTTYDYQNDGLLLGWGLRNEVGLGEHPGSGGLWGVENSADQIFRYGVDVHANNPGEELNFLGYLNGISSPNQGTNFGYPWCFSTWNLSGLPEAGNLTIGKQFAISPDPSLNNQNQTDAYCAVQTPPRLVFHSHMAPLDIKFNNSGQEAWVTFHGSWDSPDPVGYKLSLVNFTVSGEPLDLSTSTTAAQDVFANEDNSACPNNCFRPATMAIDGRGRIFMSSDASGEIYLITRETITTGTLSSLSPRATSSGTQLAFGLSLVLALSLLAIMST